MDGYIENIRTNEFLSQTHTHTYINIYLFFWFKSTDQNLMEEKEGDH